MAKNIEQDNITPIKKDEALQDILLLVKQNNISLQEIEDAFNRTSTQVSKVSGTILSKLFGYMGGIFVFAGIGVFISMFWADLGSASRVIATLGAGLAIFFMGFVCLTDKRYARAATPSFLMASLLQPLGILVMLEEYSSGGDYRYGLLFMAGYMVIQQGVTFLAKRHTVLAFSAILFACIFLANLFDILGLGEELIAIVLGTSLICIAYALKQSQHSAISSFWYFIGAVLLLWATFDLVEGTPFELVYFGLSAFVVFLSTVVRSRALLFVGALSILIYIGYYTSKHFADTVGWPIALVIIGVALIAMSALAIRINNKYIKSIG